MIKTSVIDRKNTIMMPKLILMSIIYEQSVVDIVPGSVR